MLIAILRIISLTLKTKKHKEDEENAYGLGVEGMMAMQTITAEVPQMDRGVSSDKRHLTAQQYKSFAEKAKLKQLEEERIRKEKQMKEELERLKVSKARKEAAIESAKTISDGIKGLFGQFQGQTGKSP